jgi:hypothetical protein
VGLAAHSKSCCLSAEHVSRIPGHCEARLGYKGNTMFQIDGNRLSLDKGSHVDFDLPIKCAIEVSGIIILALDVPRGETMNENVFGVSSEGRIIWQLERIPDTSTSVSAYMNVTERLPDTLLPQLERFPEYKGLREYYNRPGTFVAGNWNGTEAIVDVKTGKVLHTFLLK